MTLTCKLEIKSKDCNVRQWSGGADGKAIMYNGITSKPYKYQENVDLQSTNSLIIKNVSESDVNVNYTCSCDFNSFKKKVSLEEKLFHCKFKYSWCVRKKIADFYFALPTHVLYNHYRIYENIQLQSWKMVLVWINQQNDLRRWIFLCKHPWNYICVSTYLSSHITKTRSWKYDISQIRVYKSKKSFNNTAKTILRLRLMNL